MRIAVNAATFSPLARKYRPVWISARLHRPGSRGGRGVDLLVEHMDAAHERAE
jgi:hypothetical protein